MDFQRLFGKWKDTREFAAGTVVFAEGDPADAMYVILEGSVDLKLRGHALATEQAGGIIGITAVSESAHRNATAIARTDVRLARLDPEQVRKKMDDHPEFSKQVMRGLAHRLRDVDRFITAHLDKAN